MFPDHPSQTFRIQIGQWAPTAAATSRSKASGSKASEEHRRQTKEAANGTAKMAYKLILGRHVYQIYILFDNKFDVVLVVCVCHRYTVRKRERERERK